MDMYGVKDKSIPQKVTLMSVETIIVVVSGWILFFGGFEWLAGLFGAGQVSAGNHGRRIILFVFILISYARFWITTTILLQRKMPWEEVISVSFAFLLYYVGFGLLGYESKQPLDSLDVIGTFIFLFGGWLNTAGEMKRYYWKKRPENKGKLYTGGYFRYAMHINYFGDILWVSGFAILTRNWYSVIIPLWLIAFFLFFNIPKLDAYLAGKYGKAFEDYRKKTKKLFPFIY
ncbi:MAG: isoprenylcysteine carboxylmethyltransferase family protein [Chlorobi bacterium]|nr:isoprenylcysteine carboxylmethyltransferase family protein [Chlorobiota bacterium]